MVTSGLLIFIEIVLVPERGFGVVVLVGEVGPPARAEVDVPAPEASKDALGVLVIPCLESAGLAGEMLFSHNVIHSFTQTITKIVIVFERPQNTNPPTPTTRP